MHPDVHTLAEVNEDVLRPLTRPGRVWWALVALSLAGIGLFFGLWIFQLYAGIGVTGLNSPVGWGVYTTTFVFWVGIAHAGTLLSAILFLFRARWRQSIYRVAEAMTVFAVVTAALFPLVHLGRAWHAYWLAPYPNARFLWPNFKSPLVWDVFAVGTYFAVSASFFFLGAVPDLAAARDRATGVRRKIYGVLSLGWRGSDTQWHHFGKTYVLLAALAAALVVSVHSVVSWDFAVSIVPGWHSTIFAPYFVAGAVYSGLAMVITLIVPIRKLFGFEKYVTVRHFDAMAKLLLLASLIVLYSYLSEFFAAWYSGDPIERATFWNRLTGPYAWATWTMLLGNGLVSVALWLRLVRRSVPALFALSIVVNVAMWLERYVIVVTSLQHGYEPWGWGAYRPSLTEMGILLGSFCWFGLWFLLFARFLPLLAIAELKEVLPPPLRSRTQEARP